MEKRTNSIIDLMAALCGESEFYKTMGVNIVKATKDQALQLAQVSALSGVIILNDAKAALRLFKGAAKNIGGAFADSEQNPMILIDTIVMNANINDSEYFRVLAHELSHATGTKNRLNRTLDGLSSQEVTQGSVTIDYAIEELIAETSAAQVLKNLGLSTPELVEKSNKYVDRIWNVMKRDKPEVDLTLIEARVNRQASEACAMVTEWMQVFSKQAQKAA